MDLAASKEVPSSKADLETGEVTPGKGADILRHFVSSLSVEEKSHRAMAEAIRGHWGCETRHWERDKVWCEDECLLRSPNAACALAILRVAAKAVLVGVGRMSVTHATEEARERADLAISWLRERDLGG